jgi:hypothetical protein
MQLETGRVDVLTDRPESLDTLPSRTLAIGLTLL